MKNFSNTTPISVFPGRAAALNGDTVTPAHAIDNNAQVNFFLAKFNSTERQNGDGSATEQVLHEPEFSQLWRQQFEANFATDSYLVDGAEASQTPALCEGQDAIPRAGDSDTVEMCNGQDAVTGMGSGDATEIYYGTDAMPLDQDSGAMETCKGNDPSAKQAGHATSTFSSWDATSWMLNFYLNRGDAVIRGGELDWQTTGDNGLPINANQLLSASGKSDAGHSLLIQTGDVSWR